MFEQASMAAQADYERRVREARSRLIRETLTRTPVRSPDDGNAVWTLNGKAVWS